MYTLTRTSENGRRHQHPRDTSYHNNIYWKSTPKLKKKSFRAHLQAIEINLWLTQKFEGEGFLIIAIKRLKTWYYHIETLEREEPEQPGLTVILDEEKNGYVTRDQLLYAL